MARKAAAPWRIYPRDGYAWLDTTIAGRRIRQSLDVAISQPPSRAQRRAAEAAAEKRYGELVSGRTLTRSERVLTALTLEEAFGSWLDAIETPNNRPSIATRRTYGRTIVAWADALNDERTLFERVASDWGPQAFAQSRLCQVIRRTVRKEVSSLMAFLAWACGRGYLSAVAPRPVLPPSEPGVRSGKQRAKPVPISASEAIAIVRALPEWSAGRLLRGQRHGAYRVRAPNEFAWEMAMRPITVARLRVPQNWQPGSDELVLLDADDKARFGRSLKLTARAKAILEECADGDGLIFGSHEYSEFLKAAALKVLPSAKAAQFAAYDLRHGRAKALLRAGASLEGVAYVLGHKQLTTTNVYLAGDGKGSGDDAIDLVDAVTILSPDTDEGTDSLVGARGFEPPTPRPPAQDIPVTADESGTPAATESAEKADEPPPGRPHSARFRHGELGDLARGLAVEMAVWEAFDLFALEGEEADS